MIWPANPICRSTDPIFCRCASFFAGNYAGGCDHNCVADVGHINGVPGVRTGIDGRAEAGVSSALLANDGPRKHERNIHLISSSWSCKSCASDFQLHSAHQVIGGYLVRLLWPCCGLHLACESCCPDATNVHFRRRTSGSTILRLGSR